MTSESNPDMSASEGNPNNNGGDKGDKIAKVDDFSRSLVQFVDEHNLPTENILVEVEERKRVLHNLEDALSDLYEDQRERSLYLSKFSAAVATGLFDAALNYLWDETINELRRRISQYDISYFFDVTINNPDKRKGLSSPEDLSKIQDSDLIRGANEIGLISDIGYKHLDHIRYMRNWASAAHPNQNQITGLQLVSWLETCINEVVSLPPSNVVVETNRLLGNIKSGSIDEKEASQIASFFKNLDQDRANSLAAGFFGIYTSVDSDSQTRQNIRLLLPRLWPIVGESKKKNFGVKFAQYVANNEQESKKYAREFLDEVDAVEYIPDGIRSAEIQDAINNLLSAHTSRNNFHNEPAFAKRLKQVVGSSESVPDEIEDTFVHGVVNVFLTNGHGEAWSAQPVYEKLVSEFDSDQAVTAVLSFTDVEIESKLQHPLCEEKFLELLDLVEGKITAPVVQDLIDAIRDFNGPMENISSDNRIQEKVQNIKTILGE